MPGPASEGLDARKAVLPAKVRIPTVQYLRRLRLDGVLERLRGRRLALVAAPPGAGKTTLLVQLAAAAKGPVAWYRTEAAEAEPELFLRYVGAALDHATGAMHPPARSLEELVKAIESFPGERLLLLLDDLHALQGTPSERLLERLIENAPPSLSIVAAARAIPRFNLSRLRVSDLVVELDGDDLRFRTWETERLFRDFYHEPLPPEDLAALTRRTEGWAAGLQLFHLATKGKPPHERRRLIASLSSRSKLVRDYLARNVLAGLSPQLREFLLGTCVLGRVTGGLCDRLLGREGSAALLEQLEARQIFCVALDDEGAYRYHEVLRSHLEMVLVEQVGEVEARARYRHAAELLEQAGHLPEALAAYCRGQDLASASRLLGVRGEQLAGRGGDWLELLPATLVRNDPWLMLASARHEFAAGRLAGAVAAYGRAIAASSAGPSADAARRERSAAQLWLDPTPMPGPRSDWVELLRMAVRRQPATAAKAAAALPGPQGRLAAGLAALLAGYRRRALTLLAGVTANPDAGAELVLGARLGTAFAALLAGETVPGRAQAEGVAADAERLGLRWLARAGRAMLAVSGDPEERAGAGEIRRRCERDGDAWGAALAGWFEALGALSAGEHPIRQLEHTTGELRRLEAGTLEAWSRSLLALALTRAGEPDAGDTAAQAEAFARSAGVHGARAVALLVLAANARGQRRAELAAAGRAMIEAGGFSWSDVASRVLREHAVEHDAPPRVVIRCFGGFSMELDGVPVDLTGVKPRARTALRLLAVRAGRRVHREQLVDALWPGVDAHSGTRNLQVAVSAVRRQLEPNLPRGASSLVVREGDAYRLNLPDGAEVDTLVFEQALASARVAHDADTPATARTALTRALDVYQGDLLPEDGPAEWIIELREQYRTEATNAAVALAELEVDAGNPRAAAAACERGLAIDHYRDELWRLLREAHERAGHHAAAARAARAYESVLLELGLPAADNGTAPHRTPRPFGEAAQVRKRHSSISAMEQDRPEGAR